MKRLMVSFAAVGLLAGVCHADENKLDLKEQKAKDSYSIGFQFGEGLKRQVPDVDVDVMMAAVKDALAGKESQMSPEEMRSTMVSLRQRALAFQQKQLKEEGAKNLAAGKAFLEENGKKEGVKTLPSGLEYKVLKEGAGPSPKAADKVTVNYRGTLIDGTEFDSSYKRNKPVTFPVKGVIPGWTEALQLMKEGGKWELFVPAKLAYGERGIPPRIPPNSTLVFDVELLKIEPIATKPAATEAHKPEPVKAEPATK